MPIAVASAIAIDIAKSSAIAIAMSSGTGSTRGPTGAGAHPTLGAPGVQKQGGGLGLWYKRTLK